MAQNCGVGQAGPSRRASRAAGVRDKLSFRCSYANGWFPRNAYPSSYTTYFGTVIFIWGNVQKLIQTMHRYIVEEFEKQKLRWLIGDFDCRSPSHRHQRPNLCYFKMVFDVFSVVSIKILSLHKGFIRMG